MTLTVLFDLDGTLIDSAPGILHCFGQILAADGVTPRLPLDSRLIGPPLAETLMRLSGRDATGIAPLVEAFKRCYDGDGVRATPAYPGIAELLAGLRAAGHQLHIATNKRLAPSLAILDHLGLRRHFASVNALDMCEPRIADKATLIDRVLAEQGIDRRYAVYVGDKDEDGQAADANGLPFLAVAWGYGDFDPAAMPADWRYAPTPAALREMIARLA